MVLATSCAGASSGSARDSASSFLASVVKERHTDGCVGSTRLDPPCLEIGEDVKVFCTVTQIMAMKIK